VELAVTENPALIVLDRFLPGDGLETCRAIRASGEIATGDIPIIITAAEEEIGPGIAAGVTDWLIKPFSEFYARTRMRAWLMRMTCRWVLPPLPAQPRDPRHRTGGAV
jgi:CheY-like chemotaxis protein